MDINIPAGESPKNMVASYQDVSRTLALPSFTSRDAASSYATVTVRIRGDEFSEEDQCNPYVHPNSHALQLALPQALQ